MPNSARIMPLSVVIGFVTGLGAIFLETSVSGMGVYRRETSRLMKEMEA